MKHKIAKYAKAILAGVMAGSTALASVQEGGVTLVEWALVVSAVLATYGIVAVVPNSGYRYVGK
ncbi:MAG TPA: hypothetical protein VFR23_25055 [Jiangellaceae bacterium]|nr:hypothetical protein [Jiangellaceae bacterium]